MYRLTVHINNADIVERKIKVGKEERTKRFIFNTKTIRNIPSLKEAERMLTEIRTQYGIRTKHGKELYNIVLQ
jgi:hypothetical protein